MKFEPQCKKQSDLHREWARVLDMFAGTGVTGFWRMDGLQFSGTFDYWTIAPERVEWPISKVEGKPVFRGDVLYDPRGHSFTAGEANGIYLCEPGYSDRGCGISQVAELCTWNPPRRTITINGMEVKAPDEIRAKVDNCYLYPNEITIRFKNAKDAEVFKSALEGKQP